MALVRINKEEKNIFATLSFNREAVFDDNGRIVGAQITGVIAMRDYYDSIDFIESERFILDGVEIYKEGFGSNEYPIYYYFTAEKLDVKPDTLHEDIRWLIEEELIEGEKEGKEWYHAYLIEEGLEEARKLAMKYKEEEGSEDEE